MKKFGLSLSALLWTFSWTGMAQSAKIGVAHLEPKSGSGAKGTVTFSETAKGIKIDAKLSGVSAGSHGIHIHEKGDCSATDAASAGGHFNPGKTDHGAPSDSKRHAGDFGNITIDDKGNGSLELDVSNPDGFKEWHSIVGKSVILHKNPDDLKTQPTGNAGDRIACGVISK